MGYVKVWRTEKNKEIMFWVEKPVVCDLCKKEIISHAIHILDWTKLGLFESLFHDFCSSKYKQKILSVVPERKFVVIVDQRPSNSVLVTPQPPTFIARNRSELSIDYLDMVHKPSDKTTDKTRYSGYDSIEGASIGRSVGLVCDEKDQLLVGGQGLDVLDKLLVDSRQADDELKKKQIEVIS